MGLHTGEARVETGYVGIDVHQAARVCAAGHGGQILLSDTTRRLVTESQGDGLSLRDLGKHRLKDLPGVERLFQVVAAGLSAEFPALKSLDALPNSLPRQLLRLIGRPDTTVTGAPPSSGLRAWLWVVALGVIAVAATTVWQIGLAPKSPVSRALPPASLTLGPQAKDPVLPPDETYFCCLGTNATEIKLAPEEEKYVNFLTFPGSVACVDQRIHFAWSLRRPFPANGPIVEFFYEGKGAHKSYGTAPTGEGSGGGCGGVSAVNRSKDDVLIEVRYLLSIPKGTVDASVIDWADGLRHFLMTADPRYFKWHMEHYADTVLTYFTKKNVSSQSIYNEKLEFLQSYPTVVEYRIRNLRVQVPSPFIAEAMFDKSWDFRTKDNRRFAGNEQQRLTLRLERAGWRIISEEELKIYWVVRP